MQAVSRAIGDFELKKYVISDPEIRSVLRSKTQRFILLATDGLWDVFSNHEAVQFIEDNWETPGHGCRALAREAYHRGSFDNVCFTSTLTPSTFLLHLQTHPHLSSTISNSELRVQCAT